MVRALDFYPWGPGSNSTTGGKFFFSYASFLCCGFARWGLSRDWTLFRRKWLHVIKNDDFLEKVLRPSTPSFDYLPWQITHSVYIQSLTTASGSRLFGSVVSALDFYPGGPGSIPTTGGKFFQLCFIPLLRLSCRKMGARPGYEPGTSRTQSENHIPRPIIWVKQTLFPSQEWMTVLTKLEIQNV